jgi:16S rRNA (adenine(1408)-N(1))-methyltransferase
VTIDIGTGDGAYALARARTHPAELVVGLDANASAMVEASRRASRDLPNAVFLVAAAEAVPSELASLASLVTIHFPWGSLLDALTGSDPHTAGRIAALVAPGGALRLLVAAAPRDHRGSIDPVAIVGELGMRPTLIREANLDDARAAHSSWGKRLLSRPDPARRAWLIEMTRSDGPETSGHRPRRPVAVTRV